MTILVIKNFEYIIRTLHIIHTTGVIVFNSRIHYSFGLILSLYLIAIGGINLNPILVVIGSLFPDADHRDAPAGKILPLWKYFKHRGFTHTLYALILFSFFIVLVTREILWGVSFAVGYLSHLILDSMTPSGVNWLGKEKGLLNEQTILKKRR